MPHVVNDRPWSPMEPGSERPPTKEEFDHWCEWKVSRILNALVPSIVKYEAFNALASGQEIPKWVKEMLLDAFRPPPSNRPAARDTVRAMGGTGSRQGGRS
jgi:hypothetical protein